MNCYIDKRNTKFYCLNSIIPDEFYDWTSNHNEEFVKYGLYSINYGFNPLHREDGPAYEDLDGETEWFYNGLRHRVGGPACHYSNEEQYWYYMGKKHREDGPASTYKDGCKWWYYNNQWIDCKDNDEFLKIIKMMAFL